jgi:MoaA/NifB/PqqE/SkfB family radical SAM enzyme
MLKGINDNHIETVVKKMKSIGCYITNIMQLIPVKGSAFEDMPLVNQKEIMAMRQKCGEHLNQMYHCHQCRADAIGTLDNDVSIEYRGCTAAVEKLASPPPQQQRFAVATKSGMLVDQHFGQVSEFYIYESDGKRTHFLERRKVKKYCQGNDVCDEKINHIDQILHTIEDCNSVLALRVGDAPMKKLGEMGIRVITTYDRIEDAVKKAANQ